MEVITYEHVADKIIEVRQQKVIIDSDVAVLYGVETKRINEAVKNNLDKFPDGYIFELDEHEKSEVVENFDHLQNLKFAKALPKAFTERGLYMLATILKSTQATKTTLLIIDTFAKVREIGRSINQLTQLPEGSAKQKSLVQRTGELLSELIQPTTLETEETESSIELNLAVIKFKHSVKKTKGKG